jgi:bifunctional UDP-N-acetylglucosamine pyrophosphorylase/glucosamine-1-phosphate N-acetyltransferase
MRSSVPKVAHELLGKPLIHWVADAAFAAGTKGLICVVGHGRNLVEPLLENYPLANGNLKMVVQNELNGTGHAVMMAREHLEALAARNSDESLIILNGDVPLITANTIAKLAKLREQEQADCCVLGFTADDPHGYGRLLRDNDGFLTGIKEERDATDTQRQIKECNSGVYCFSLAALLKSLDGLTNNNAQGEYYLTDVVGILAKQKSKVLVQMTSDPSELQGVNDRVQLAKLGCLAQERINREHMLNGVTMLDPRSAWIGPDVTLACDVEVLPMTIIYGKTNVGEGSVVGPNTRLNNVRIGTRCVVDETIAIDVILEDRVSVGPRAYLRPGTVMRTGSRAGTHVEIKKSDIGPDSKVPHLSYIGDAILGTNVNIGAGSITCNYDGANKNLTKIGDNSFIGSDTMFIAPVTVGDNVTTGAGSVISKDVPDGALAITRPEQRTVQNWAASRKNTN